MEASTCKVMVPVAGPGATASLLMVDLRLWVMPKHRLLPGTQQVVEPGAATRQHTSSPTVSASPVGPVGLTCRAVSVSVSVTVVLSQRDS